MYKTCLFCNGDLGGILDAAWREAEEIAGIADNMLLPASVDADLERLKRQRDADP